MARKATQDALPDASDELVLADGTRINPETGVVIGEEDTDGDTLPDDYSVNLVEVPSHSNAVREITATRRRLADLPDVPDRTNIIGVIIAYTLYGLSETDIAIALKITKDQVTNVKALEIYQQMYDTISQSIAESEANHVRKFIEQNQRAAAQRVVRALNSGKEKIALDAAKDLLDRGGNRAADIVEHRHKMEGGLHIIVTKVDRTQEMPTIDLKPVEDSDGDSA